MKKQEIQLFKALCRCDGAPFDASLLSFAGPRLLGELFYNRMQGTAFGTIQKNGLLGSVNREFRNSLANAYEQNCERNQSYYKCVAMLAALIKSSGCHAAMLKGALLCAKYPIGYRTSNDIDLLIAPGDVTELGKSLTALGFRQGNIRNGVFVPAERKEIIASKMMRGETVPYIKEVDLPFMKYMEVDLNFSLEYKNSGNAMVEGMLESIEWEEAGDVRIPTLSHEDFFLHLCMHLYKEASTLPWVTMRRDMTLYKYSDIYMLLRDMNKSDVERLFAHAGVLGVDHICAYAIAQASELIGNANAEALAYANTILACDPYFLHTVIAPQEKKTLRYTTTDITRRFFMEDRVSDLREEDK